MSPPDQKDSDPGITMLTNELAGKHHAAQVYDERIWKIRSGFLTLSFASWGALLAVGNSLAAIREGASALVIITLALAIAGFAVECFYVARKFRCIEVINDMGAGIHRIMSGAQPANPEHTQRWLRFSGDDEQVDPRKTPGFWWAVLESFIIYLAPAVGFVVAYFFFAASKK